MRVECRGYKGNVIHLEASEEFEARIGANEKPRFRTLWYEIEIRTDDGAKVSLSSVIESEIHVTA